MEGERLVRVEESTKSAHKRVDSLENKIENIYELTISIREIAQEMKAMREDVNKLDTRVLNIEKEPADAYKNTKNQITSQVINFIVGAILTALAFYVFKK